MLFSAPLQAASFLSQGILAECQCRRLAVSRQVQHENLEKVRAVLLAGATQEKCSATKAMHHYQNKSGWRFLHKS
jgi:hypothetical protein